MNATGTYSFAKMKNSMVRRFGQGKRPPLMIQNPYNVGPGQYRLPSEFGYYQAKHVYEKNHGIKRRRKKRKVYESNNAWGGEGDDN